MSEASAVVRSFVAVLMISVSALRAEDIKTTTGQEYKNVTISRAEPDGLVIIFSGGVVKIPFAELSKELQDKYHYDPKAAAGFRRQIDEAKASRDEAVAAAKEKTRQATLAAPPPAPAATPAAPAVRHNERKTPSDSFSRVEPSDDNLRSEGGMERPTEKWFVQGHVLQVIEGKGILISTIKSSALGMPQPKDRSLVLVVGKFNPLLDYDDSIAMDATPAGTYKYVTVQGASKTVLAFQFLNPRTVLPPMDPFERR